jgi:L-rhamnose-H+ transport protein
MEAGKGASTMTTLVGTLVVAAAGLIVGSGGWPMKLMRQLQFEHWWYVGMLVGLIVMPWAVTLSLCPDALNALGSVDTSVLIRSNLFALGWGVANVLCGLCFVRIGFALTGAILAGLGVSLGVTMPMIVKGSGLFKDAADLGSPAGKAVLVGVAVMVIAVVLASLAGLGRDRALKKLQKTQGSFLIGLLMAIVSGILSTGISFAFVYSQGPILEAMKACGAGEVPAIFAVWALGLSAGALVNVLYPAYLMTRHKSWGVLGRNLKEVGLAAIIGMNFSIGVAMMGQGMLLLGAIGASVGFGIQQSTQMLGNQGVGFISGEWRGVSGTPRYQMVAAIVLLTLAATIMAYGNTLVAR